MASGFLHGVKEERLTARQVAEAVNQFPFTGAGRIQVQGGRGGTSIGFNGPPLQITDIRLAVLTDEGPNGDEENFEDARYWTQAARPDGTRQDEGISILPDKATYPDDWWVPASNLAEWLPDGGTHLLPTDGTTLVLLVRLVDSKGNERFVFSETPVPVTFPARLGASTQDASGPPPKKQWTYAYTEVAKTGAGYGNWTTKAGGRSGTAYNRSEDVNADSGLYGNGVNSANLVGTFDIQPAPPGVIVQMELVPRADDPAADPEAWFGYENGIDGACA